MLTELVLHKFLRCCRSNFVAKEHNVCLCLAKDELFAKLKKDKHRVGDGRGYHVGVAGGRSYA